MKSFQSLIISSIASLGLICVSIFISATLITNAQVPITKGGHWTTPEKVICDCSKDIYVDCKCLVLPTNNE